MLFLHMKEHVVGKLATMVKLEHHGGEWRKPDHSFQEINRVLRGALGIDDRERYSRKEIDRLVGILPVALAKELGKVGDVYLHLLSGVRHEGRVFLVLLLRLLSSRFYQALPFQHLGDAGSGHQNASFFQKQLEFLWPKPTLFS